MKKSTKIKKAICHVVAGLAIILPSAIFAAPGAGSNPADVFKPVTHSVNQVSKELEAIAFATVKSVSLMLNQVDNYFPSTVPTNSEGLTSEEIVQQSLMSLTQSEISNALLAQFPAQLKPSIAITDPSLTFPTVVPEDQQITELTSAVPASDTLFLTGDFGCPQGGCINSAAKPEKNYDNYFNFDSLIVPFEYTSDQKAAASHFIQYALGTYNTVNDGLDFDQLNQTLSNLPKSQRAGWLQSHVLNNPIYQKYQLNIRSLMAERSLFLSNMNYLYAQRVSQTGLGNDLGLNNASPLETQNYVTQHVLNNPKWYQQMKTASPATVAREQLLILADIDKQLHRSEQTNQRVLATLTILAAQTTNASAPGALKQMADTVNDLFKNSQ